MKVYTLEWTYASNVSGVFDSLEKANKMAEYIQNTFGEERYKYPNIEEWDVS